MALRIFRILLIDGDIFFSCLPRETPFLTNLFQNIPH